MLHPAKNHPKSSFSLSKHMGTNYDSRVQKTAHNYRNYRSCTTMENKLGADETSMVVEDDSGVCSPPLRGTNPSNNIYYKCLSPSSKAQAIARGQKELMDMVSRMPESCFELTLKDLVELKDVVVEPKQDSLAEGKDPINNKENGKKKKKKKKNPKPQINRSGSMDNGGFLLKMVFPFSLGSKSKKTKKTKNESNKNHNSKVSPKPIVSNESGKSIDKECWEKRSGSSQSDGSGSNINSGSTKSNRSSSRSINNTNMNSGSTKSNRSSSRSINNSNINIGSTKSNRSSSRSINNTNMNSGSTKSNRSSSRSINNSNINIGSTKSNRSSSRSINNTSGSRHTRNGCLAFILSKASR